MSEEQLKAFLKKVKGDTSLQEKFKAAASPDAAVEIAKEAGFAITAITIFFFAITIIEPHTTVQAQCDLLFDKECKEAERPHSAAGIPNPGMGITHPRKKLGISIDPCARIPGTNLPARPGDCERR